MASRARWRDPLKEKGPSAVQARLDPRLSGLVVVDRVRGVHSTRFRACGRCFGHEMEATPCSATRSRPRTIAGSRSPAGDDTSAREDANILSDALDTTLPSRRKAAAARSARPRARQPARPPMLVRINLMHRRPLDRLAKPPDPLRHPAQMTLDLLPAQTGQPWAWPGIPTRKVTQPVNLLSSPASGTSPHRSGWPGQARP
jgi:hypothetical protein